ncbi:MAG: hypothetical protein IT162_03885 [Bryobacterales bacterium]|nr:hypothetical protein [Bryobacterales bacterium]
MLLLAACGSPRQPHARWASAPWLPVRADLGEWPADSLPGYVTLRLTQPSPAPLLLVLHARFDPGPTNPQSPWGYWSGSHPEEPIDGAYRIDFEGAIPPPGERQRPGRASAEVFFAAYVPGQRAEVLRGVSVPFAGGHCRLRTTETSCTFDGPRPDLLEFVRDPRIPASGPRFRLAPRDETDSMLFGRQPVIVQAWREVGLYRARFDTMGSTPKP